MLLPAFVFTQDPESCCTTAAFLGKAVFGARSVDAKHRAGKTDEQDGETKREESERLLQGCVVFVRRRKATTMRDKRRVVKEEKKDAAGREVVTLVVERVMSEVEGMNHRGGVL